MIKPSDYYQQLVINKQIEANSEQENILPLLDDIFAAIHQIKQKPFLTRLTWQLMPNKRPQGVYLWGDVGIGKTLLIDCLCRCLPSELRLRTHFHQFMANIHQQMFALKAEENPLEIIANDIAKKTRLLALDEFLVKDISNAMILSGILKALHKRNVFIITTANLAPDDLYQGGLQRQRFLPAIAWLKEKLHICHLNQQKDYRTKKKPGTKKTSVTSLKEKFNQLALGLEKDNQPLIIYQRPVKIVAQAGDVIWIDFIALCNIPRSYQDYLAICEKYKVILLDNLITIKPNQHHFATNFIKLIDVLYDQNIKIYLDPKLALTDIYPEGRFKKPFKRTLSRLNEMKQ